MTAVDKLPGGDIVFEINPPPDVAADDRVLAPSVNLSPVNLKLAGEPVDGDELHGYAVPFPDEGLGTSS